MLGARACGVVVIVTEVEGWTGRLQRGGESGELGLLVPVGSPAMLAEGIEQILTHPDECKAMATESQLHVSSNLTWDMTATAYDQLYRDLLRG